MKFENIREMYCKKLIILYIDINNNSINCFIKSLLIFISNIYIIIIDNLFELQKSLS